MAVKGLALLRLAPLKLLIQLQLNAALALVIPAYKAQHLSSRLLLGIEALTFRLKV